MGGGCGRDAGRAGRPRPGVAHGDRGARGRLFKHTGDGACAAFASPRSAIDAAVAAQRELELPVRMGIATGEAKLREGDYFGTVLNRAARDGRRQPREVSNGLLWTNWRSVVGSSDS